MTAAVVVSHAPVGVAQRGGQLELSGIPFADDRDGVKP